MNKQHRRNLKAAAMTASDAASRYRDTIREQLDAIVAAVQLALREAELSQPVFLSIPRSGDAILSFATPLDPSDADWNKISAIVASIVGEKTGLRGLIGRDLACSVATGKIAGADLHAG